MHLSSQLASVVGDYNSNIPLSKLHRQRAKRLRSLLGQVQVALFHVLHSANVQKLQFNSGFCQRLQRGIAFPYSGLPCQRSSSPQLLELDSCKVEKTSQSLSTIGKVRLRGGRCLAPLLRQVQVLRLLVKVHAFIHVK